MKEKYCSEYVKFYASCFPIKGYNRSLICDLQFGTHQLIANELYDVLTHQPTLTLAELYEKFDEQEHETITEYISYLVEKDFIFFTETPELFPALEKSWDSPAIITNAVIVIDALPSPVFMERLVSQLNELDCEAVLLSCSIAMAKDELAEVLDYFEHSTILSIQLDMINSEHINNEFIKELIINCKRISYIQIFGCETYKKDEYFDVAVFYQPAQLFGECGGVRPELFCFSKDGIMEARCYNSCLNRKISIDTSGGIKNCPHSKVQHGNLFTNSIKSIVQKESFQHLWSTTKDYIDVCKDCEFRYVCIDCRIFIKDSSNIYSQPTSCSYNPYISRWKYEKGYIPVEECGVYSPGGGFEVDHDRVEQLNKMLWE